MEWEGLCLGGRQPFRRRAWEQVGASIPCELLSIPWFQQSSSEVPQRDWRKPGRAECLLRNGCSGPPQYLWGAVYSGRTAGDAQTTFCPDLRVILQRHNRCHAPQCGTDEDSSLPASPADVDNTLSRHLGTPRHWRYLKTFPYLPRTSQYAARSLLQSNFRSSHAEHLPGIVAKQSCSEHDLLSTCIYQEYDQHIHTIYNTYTWYMY